MAYQSSYELLTNYGYALLEQLEDEERRVQYDPNDEGDPEAYNELYYSGMYGGDVDLEADQEFIVYSLELPEQTMDLDEDELWATLGAELDNHFGRWAIDRQSSRVYIMSDPPQA